MNSLGPDDDVRVRFLIDCEIEIVDQMDEQNDQPESHLEVFKAGSEVEFFVIDHPTKYNGEEDTSMVNVQFPNGSMAFGLSTEWFEVIAE